MPAVRWAANQFAAKVMCIESLHTAIWSPPKIYEIWAGEAVILMQESTIHDAGRCYAVDAGPGDKVIVPPGWAHATVSAD